jgi:hypothetical protein
LLGEAKYILIKGKILYIIKAGVLYEENIEDKNVRLDYWDTTRMRYIKAFSIQVFSKDGNFQKLPDYIEKLYAESMSIFNTMRINN